MSIIVLHEETIHVIEHWQMTSWYGDVSFYLENLLYQSPGDSQIPHHISQSVLNNVVSITHWQKYTI